MSTKLDISNRQKQITRGLWVEARANGYQIVVFWQDHFYTRDRKFGYPVCIQLQSHIEPDIERVETSRIVRWSSSKNICADTVEAIDAYLAELEGVTEHA